jgi:hypothetical protein
MKKASSKLAIVTGVLALSAAPAFALPSQAPSNQGTANAPSTPAGPPSATPPDNPGTAHKPSTPGPNASLPSKAKAYGKLCQGTSKKRSDAAPGTHGTPFSQCVTAMAKAANGQANTAKSACKGVSKTKAAGQHKTAFAICVTSAAKLLKDQHTS